MKRRFLYSLMSAVFLLGLFGTGTAAADPDNIAQPAWTQLDANQSVGNPAVQAISPTEATTVFVASANGSVVGRNFNGGYGATQNIGGFAVAGPGMSLGNVMTSGVAVWVQGGDHSLWRNECNPALTSCIGWRSHGGGLKDNPAAVRVSGNNLHVFIRGLDDQLWWNVVLNDGTDRGWVPLGGGLTSGPAVAVTDDGDLAVLTRGGDGAVWMLTVDLPGGPPPPVGWRLVGGAIVGGPAVINDNLTVLATGTDNGLWYNSQNGCCFTFWTKLNGVLTSGPAASFRHGDPNCTALPLAGRGGDGLVWVARPLIGDQNLQTPGCQP